MTPGQMELSSLEGTVVQLAANPYAVGCGGGRGCFGE